MEFENIDITFDLEMEQEQKQSKKKPEIYLCNVCKQEIKPDIFIRKAKNIYRKAYGEVKLFDMMPKSFKENDVIHIISGGNIDSLSYIQYMLKKQKFKYMLFSTWCMAKDDVLWIKENLENKNIDKLDAYVGEIFQGSYANEYEMLTKILNKTKGRICVFKNHAKIFAVKGYDFDFVIESSANINTNPRNENTTITIGTEAFYFYKDFFDNIKSINKHFDKWVKQEV